MTAYRDSQDHLLDELERVLLLVGGAVLETRRMPAPGRETATLAILDEEVDWQLARPLRREAPGPEHAALLAAADRAAQDIAARVEASRHAGVSLRLAALARRFGLDRPALDVLLLALAPEIDPRFERLLGYLHDDLGRRRASIGLALRVLGRDDAGQAALRRDLTRAGTLLGEGLLRRVEAEASGSLLGAPLMIEERVLEFLLGVDEPEPSLRPLLRRGDGPTLADLVVSAQVHQRLEALAMTWRSGQVGEGLYLHGAAGSGRATGVEAVCAELGLGCLRITTTTLVGHDAAAFARVVDLLRREALLGGLVLVWEELDALDEARRAQVLQRMQAAPGVRAAYTGTLAWEPAGAALAVVGLERPDLAQRRRLWTAALRRHAATLPEAELAAVVGSYGFAAGPAHELVASALRHADPGAPRLTRAGLAAAVRRRSTRALGALARPLASGRDWDELVLASDRKQLLAGLCRHAQHREQVLESWGFRQGLAGSRGLTALFTGASGTGKTMAAGLIARQLGLEGWQIDLASVVSKYIGETEKQLARLFDEAEAAAALLFFDEADALFGKRTEVRDAHDRYANIETSYLLQRLDHYDGVVVLASNFRKNMDEAFLRRMQFIVDFPVPESRERLAIWNRVLPTTTPRAPDLDLGALAERFVLPGGNIRNIAVAAAFLAAEDGGPLAMRHLVAATRREYQKLGKVVEAACFSGLA